MIDNEKLAHLDSASKTSIRFAISVFDKNIHKIAEGWSKSNRILLFEFKNYDNRLLLNLYVGPGPKEYRDKLINYCQSNPDVFEYSKTSYAGEKWQSVFRMSFLIKKDMENKEYDALTGKIDEKWNEFLSGPFIEIYKYFENFE